MTNETISRCWTSKQTINKQSKAKTLLSDFFHAIFVSSRYNAHYCGARDTVGTIDWNF